MSYIPANFVTTAVINANTLFQNYDDEMQQLMSDSGAYLETEMAKVYTETGNIVTNGIGINRVENIASLKLQDGLVFNTIEVLGYYTKGDGGGGTFYWDSTSTESDNGGTIIQATGITTGRWKRVFSGAINVKWFGVTELDYTKTSILSYVLNTFQSVYIPAGNYYISPSITITKESVEIFGDGCQNTILIKYGINDGNILNFDNFGCSVKNISFNGGYSIFGASKLATSVNSGLLALTTNARSTIVFGCFFTNVKAPLGSNGVYGIYINGFNTTDINIQSCKFKDISNTTDNVSQQGFAGGIFIEGLNATTSNNLTAGIISNNIFDNIFTNGATSDSYQDGDAIRIFYTSVDFYNLKNGNLRIDNNTFNEVSGSAIKISGGRGIYIDGVSYKNTLYNAKAVVRLWGENISASNIQYSGSDIHSLAQFRGTNITLTDVQAFAKVTDYATVFESQYNACAGINISNIYIKDLVSCIAYDADITIEKYDIVFKNIKIDTLSNPVNNSGSALIALKKVHNLLIDGLDVVDTNNLMYYGIYLSDGADNFEFKNSRIISSSPNMNYFFYVGETVYTDSLDVKVTNNYFRNDGNTTATNQDFIFNIGTKTIFKDNIVYVCSKSSTTSDRAYIYSRGSYKTIKDNIVYVNSSSTYSWSMVYSRDGINSRVNITDNIFYIPSTVTTQSFARLYNENYIDIINNNTDALTVVSLLSANYVNTINNTVKSGGTSGNTATNKVDVNNNAKV